MSAQPFVSEQKHMDTRVTVTAYPDASGRDLAEAAALAFGVFAELEQRFSLFRPDSEIVRVNAAAGRKTEVSALFLETVSYALALADETGGVFDPLVGRLTTPVTSGARRVTRPTFRQVEIDEAKSCLTTPPGAVMDLNSVVKGLALDLACAVFGGDEALMIEAGGDIRLRGLPPGKSRWDIGVRDPHEPRRLAALLPVRSGAVCTSGDYFRSGPARAAGRRHLVNARNGRPAGDIASMTVLAPTAKEADALSTAAYLMPTREAAAFVERHGNASCLFIDAAGQVFASSRLETVMASQTYA
jgi:thiamine biosynthesis lipoprotein